MKDLPSTRRCSRFNTCVLVGTPDFSAMSTAESTACSSCWRTSAGYRPSRGRHLAIGHQKTPQRDCFPQSRFSNNATTISPTASSARPTFDRRHLRPGRYQRRQGGGFRHRLRRDDRFRKWGCPAVTRDNASVAGCRHDPVVRQAHGHGKSRFNIRKYAPSQAG